MKSPDRFADLPIRELLRRYDLKTDHKLGQNFLSDPALLAEIVAEAEVAAADVVIEIGAGAGTLTSALAHTGAEVWAVELDRRLAPLLQDRFAACDAVHLIFGDALQIDLQGIGNRAVASGRTLKFVANIPYYITTPLLERMMLSCPQAERLVLTVQKEVGENLCCTSGKAYGPVTILSQLFGDVSVVRQLPPHFFYPPPEVHSVVVKIRATGRPEHVDLPAFYRWLKVCFAHRRKTLLNNLKSAGRKGTVDYAVFLQETGLNLSIRPEAVAPETYLNLFKRLSEGG
jgi:16S rRNA (adenine1518-N6/adenine1519-N6)-dimethyltransferase